MSELLELIKSEWNGGKLPRRRIRTKARVRQTQSTATPSPKRIKRSPSKDQNQHQRVKLPDDYHQEMAVLVDYAYQKHNVFIQSEILLKVCASLQHGKHSDSDARLVFFQKFFEALWQQAEKGGDEKKEVFKTLLMHTWLSVSQKKDALNRKCIGGSDPNRIYVNSQLLLVEGFGERWIGSDWLDKWLKQAKEALGKSEPLSMDKLLAQVWSKRSRDQLDGLDLSRDGYDASSRAKVIPKLVENFLLKPKRFFDLDLLFWWLEGLNPQEQLQNFTLFFTGILKRINLRENTANLPAVKQIHAKIPPLLRYTLMRLVGRSRRYAAALNDAQNTEQQHQLDQMAERLFQIDKALGKSADKKLQLWIDKYKREVKETLQTLKPKGAKIVWIVLVRLFWDFWHWWGWSSQRGYTVRDIWLDRIKKYLDGLHTKKALVKERFYWFFYPTVAYDITLKKPMGFLELDLYRRLGSQGVEEYKEHVGEYDEDVWQEGSKNPLGFDVKKHTG